MEMLFSTFGDGGGITAREKQAKIISLLSEIIYVLNDEEEER
jgi:hypothetical protein